MADQTVTLVLDARQYYSEIAKVTAQTNGLGRAGASAGDGFIRGERAFRGATANIVSGLAASNSAASATILTFAGLERVLKLPIGATIVAAGVVAGIEAVNKVLEKERELLKEIGRLRFTSTLGADFLGTDQINQNLTGITAKIKEITEDLVGLKAGKFKVLGVDLIGSEQRTKFIQADEEKLAALRAGAVNDVISLTSKQNDLNRVEQERLDGAETKADLDKAEIDHKERLGKLAQLAVDAGLAETEAARQLLEVENDRFKIAQKTLDLKRQQNLIKAQEGARDFFRDVGSGKFIEDLKNKDLEDFQRRAGERLIKQLRKDAANGVHLDDYLQRVLDEANKRDTAARGAGFGSLEEVANADFSNLLELSKYNFQGLQGLSGLTITIK